MQSVGEKAVGTKGVTLVELLVVVSVVGVLLAILLPAVQAAREAARRTSCASNMRQLALAFASYGSAHGSLPMGTPMYNHPDIGVFPGHSVFVSILPFLEQKPLYDSINFDISIYKLENNTIHSCGIGTLWCPSDGAASMSTTYQYEYFNVPVGMFVTHLSSYAGCSGTWYHLSDKVNLIPALTAGDNGVTYTNSCIKYNDIIDGCSTTILLGERAHGRLPREILDLHTAHWWFDGYHSDTLFWTLRPMNTENQPIKNFYSESSAAYGGSVAGSYHPGGSNFVFADGSVRFLKESIDSWQIDRATGLPAGVTGDTDSVFRIERGTRIGVYQALSTRAGGEIIDIEY